MKWPLLLAFGLAACADLPRDPDGTSDRVREAGRFRVGLAAPLTPEAPPVRALATRLARDTGARPVFTTGAQDVLLAALEQDRLALVVAPFHRDTETIREVALGPPLDTAEGDPVIAVRAAARAGENRWIMLVERASRGVAEAR